jgi:hypothetical protein
MGATGTPSIIGGGGSVAPVAQVGSAHNLRVLTSFKMSNSYATGGDTLTLPTSDVRGKELVGVNVLTRQDGTRFYDWNGSVSAPKIKSYTAAGTEVSSTTDLSAVTLRVELIYAG